MRGDLGITGTHVHLAKATPVVSDRLGGLTQQSALRKEAASVRSVRRLGIVIPLTARAAEQAKPLLSGSIFDADGGDRQIETFPEPRDGIDRNRAVRIVGHGADEVVVDLDPVKSGGPQMRKAGEAAAELVEHQPHALII